MAQSPPRSYRVLGAALLLFVVVLAVMLYLLVGPRALVVGTVPLLGTVVISILFLAGWPWKTKK